MDIYLYNNLVFSLDKMLDNNVLHVTGVGQRMINEILPRFLTTYAVGLVLLTLKFNFASIYLKCIQLYKVAQLFHLLF